MTGRSLADSRGWVTQGTALIAAALPELTEDDYCQPCGLPGWTRKHLVAHLAANAQAVGNLIQWAATGRRMPMYASPEQRAADIEAGSGRTGTELTSWFMASSAALALAMDELDESSWSHEVVTAQGRTVAASEAPWLRAREVMIHAVDLDAGVTFAQLPDDFLGALCDDIVAKRGAAAGGSGEGPALRIEATDADRVWSVAGAGEPIAVVGTLAACAAYVSGRRPAPVEAPGRVAVPNLPAWL